MPLKVRKPRRAPRPGSLKDLSPLRILTQIILLQFAYYASAMVLIVFTALTAGRHMSLDLFLGWHNIRGDITEGWMFGLCWILNSPIAAIFILVLIARSKLVPDFALTIHFLHLIVVSVYAHAMPTNIFWWFIQIASAALMTFLGIWSCQWRELQPINLSKSGAEAGRQTAKGRDGPGDYEMVPVAD